LAKPKVISEVQRLYKFCLINKIDIVQTFFQDPTIIGALLKIGLSVKLIGSFRDLGFWRTPVESMKMRLAYPMFEGFIANSQAVKEHFCCTDNISSQKISVIYNGFDSRQKEIDFKKEDENYFNVGIVGNYNRPVKRIQDFIKASALVAQAIPNVKFTLVGGGNQEKMLRELTKDLGLKEKIRFVGVVDKAMPYIKNFDVGINTSATEGFSNAIIEYMAAGVPVVATDVGGNQELIENQVNGYLFPVGNYRQAADSIIKLLRDSQLRQLMGTVNREKVANEFSYEKMINSHQAYYQKIFSG
jgi:glycosyltransferase involved in cell wall biosynthesis